MKSLRFGLILVLALLTMILAAGPTVAADGSRGVVGLGIGVAPDYEGSEDYQAVPIPRFEYHWDSGRNVVLFGNQLTANLLTNDMWSAGPLLRYRGERDDVDNDQVDDMDKVDAAVELGGFVAVKIDKFKLELNGAWDVSDSYDGSIFELKGSYTHSFNPDFALIVSASSTYANDDYMQAYFGVDSGNRGKSTMDDFDIDAGIKDVGIGATLVQKVSDTWELLYTGKYTAIVSDANDSPLVDDEGSSGQFFGGVVASYHF